MNEIRPKIPFYKIWLWLSIAVILFAIGITALFIFTLPENCSSCGMAAVGLVPFWTLALLSAAINIIVVPIVLRKHSKSLTRNLRILSQILLVISVILLVGFTLLARLNF